MLIMPQEPSTWLVGRICGANRRPIYRQTTTEAVHRARPSERHDVVTRPTPASERLELDRPSWLETRPAWLKAWRCAWVAA